MPSTIEFKAALGNAEYIALVSSNTVHQWEFLTRLEENKFNYQDIIECIHLVKNVKVRSLLIIHLLSQQDYLDSLAEESVLERLSKPIKPSRINKWIHQLDIALLSPILINKLSPEAAGSIFLSIAHFHQFTHEQIAALLQKYSKYSLLEYWFKNFSSMPNAHFVLAHLIKLTGTLTIDILSSFPKKELILSMIIKNLNLFAPLPQRLFNLFNEEAYLILAINLYLHGNFYQSYVTFIEKITNNLLKKEHTFSSSAIDLLFAVNQVVELKQLMKNIAPLINNHLRTEAKLGQVKLFYHKGRLNIKRMNEVTTIVAAEECFLIKELAQRHKPITNFDYFLIYYQGTKNILTLVLHEYLQSYLNANLAPGDNIIHHLSFLLLREELSSHTKEALFEAFLSYPDLYDQQISHHLLVYNPVKAIQHFGFQGGVKNYTTVIRLCELALQKLNPEEHSELFHITHKAKKEAELELVFSKQQGFFYQIIKYIKRCFIYGWTGFFTPKPPIYVIPESSSQDLREQKTIIKNTHSFVKNLPELLEEITEHSPTQSEFEQLIAALGTYSLTPNYHNEFAIRMKVQNIFAEGLKKSFLSTLLNSNKNLFLDNQFRLVELAFSKYSADEVIALLQEVNFSFDQYKRLIDELNIPLPEKKLTMETNNSQVTQRQFNVLTTLTDSLPELCGLTDFFKVRERCRAASSYLDTIPKFDA